MDYLIPKNYDLRVKFGSTTIDPSPQRGWERRRPNATKGTKNEDTEWILLLRRIRKTADRYDYNRELKDTRLLCSGLSVQFYLDSLLLQPFCRALASSSDVAGARYVHPWCHFRSLFLSSFTPHLLATSLRIFCGSSWCL